MIIAHDISALRICNNLNRYTKYASKLMLQISSGQRINSAADDPAGLAISEKMRAQIRGLNQASRNAQDAISLMQTAEGHLNEGHSILQRIRELVVQASNDTYNSSNRSNIQQEIKQLIEEMDRISGHSEFNTMKLLDGSKDKAKGGLNIQVGPNAGDQVNISLGNMSSSSLGIKDIDVTGKTSTEISSILDKVDKAIANVSYQRSSLGASMNIMEKRIEYIENTSLNLQAAESRIRDVDMAKAMMEFSKVQILSQVSMILLAQANQQRQRMFELLFGNLRNNRYS